MISVIFLNDDKQFCKQDFLIVDFKVDITLWTPVYLCEILQAQATKNMQDFFLFNHFCILCNYYFVSENNCMDIKGLC